MTKQQISTFFHYLWLFGLIVAIALGSWITTTFKWLFPIWIDNQ